MSPGKKITDRKPSREGWTRLQRRGGASVLKWLDSERRLRAGFDALAEALRKFLVMEVQTPTEARDVWQRTSAVVTRCSELETYSKRGANTAYSWLHLLDRYVRTWLALEQLLLDRLLPMGKYGIGVLDVGTGPGPSAFATHDFYVALSNYSGSSGDTRWRQPPQVTCVEQAGTMNYLRHNLTEMLAVHGAPKSVIAMADSITDFAKVQPRKDRRKLEQRLRSRYEECYDIYRDEWYNEPIYTAGEAKQEANARHRYRLFTFSNFFTTLDTVSAYQSNLEEILSDAQRGSVLLIVGGKHSDYPKINEQIALLAKNSGFRRRNSPSEVASSDVQMDARLADESRWFYSHLRDLAGPLSAYDEVTQCLLDELEGRKSMRFSSSAIHAFRK